MPEKASLLLQFMLVEKNSPSDKTINHYKTHSNLLTFVWLVVNLGVRGCRIVTYLIILKWGFRVRHNKYNSSNIYCSESCTRSNHSNWSINKSISHLSLLLFTFGEYLNFRQDSIQNVSKFLVFWRLFLKWVKPKNNRQCHFLSHCGLVTLNSLKSQKKCII